MKLTSFIITLATFATLLATNCLQGAEEIFVGGLYGPIGVYATDGSVINASFISGPSQPTGMALSGNELFIVDDNLSSVGVYNATTGAAINAHLIIVQSPDAIAISGSSLFITANNFTSGQAVVQEYTTSGTLMNGSLITGLSASEGLLIIGTDLYVSDEDNGTVGKYTTSGTVVNANFITGLNGPEQLATDGSHIYVAENASHKIDEYSLTGNLITSWVTDSNPFGLAFLGADLLVTLPQGTFVTEYTGSGQVVRDPFINDPNNPFSIVVGSPGGTPTPTPKPTPTPTVTPTPPPHGGLSATVFNVDGSKSPMSGLADTILNFSALQTGTPAGLDVRVQYSVSGGNWTDLANGDAGQMTYDPALKEFITSSTSYPPMSAVSFRAISAAQGYKDSISNVVGPFNLFSTKQRLSPPILSVTGNGTFADLYFRSYIASPTSGETLRVQSSTNPLNQTSWTDLADGHSGAMTKSTDPTRYFLMDDKLPPASGIYFRVIASHTGYEDAISTPSGAFKITSDTPPTVTIGSPKAQSGNGTISSPYVYSLGNLQFTATATAGLNGGTVAGIGLTADGEAFALSFTPTVTASYTPPAIGDHLIEAIAVDSRGGTNRFGNSPVYIRIIPSTTHQVRAESSVGSHSTSDATASAKVFTLAKPFGNWTDPTTWKDAQGAHGVPGPNDFAIVTADIVYLPQAVTVKSITLEGTGEVAGGTLNSRFSETLTVTGTLTDHGTALGTSPLNNLHFVLAAGATCELWNTLYPITMKDVSVDNYGSFDIHGSLGMQGLIAFNNFGSTNFQSPLSLPPTAGMDPTIDTRILSASTLNLSGGLISDLQSHLIGQDGGGIITHDGASLIGHDGGSLISQDGGGIVAAGGGNFLPQTGGAVVSNDGGSASSKAERDVAGSPTEDDATQSRLVENAGNVDLDGVLIEGDLTMTGGILSGSGIIDGNLINNGGYISPGHSPGAVGVMGSFTQGAKGTLVIQDGGAEPNDYDQLEVAGKATLGGSLDLQLINGYKPSTKDTFSPLGYSGVSGKFANVSSNANVQVDDSGISAALNPSIPGPVPAASRNISTRAFVQTGQNVVIGGFIVGGPAGSSKKVIIRGIGPSLSSVGIQGALADPVLELFKGSALLTTNDNWKENRAAVQATGLAPKDDAESAIVATLEPGSYTAILSGANNTTGVGLVEVYDLAPDSAASLANISTRCSVQTGDQVLIGGFILDGEEPAQVLVRALGPSLSAFGIKGALADPTLQLYDANGDATTNDDWINIQKAEITATGLAPSNNKDSAILATLPPGAYTAIVAGKDGGTGIALVEVYQIQ